jgi:hypothetical protein
VNDRVGGQIQHDLSDLSLVRPYLTQATVDVRVQSEGPPSGPFAYQGQGTVEGRWEMEIAEFQLHSSGLDLGEIQDVVD